MPKKFIIFLSFLFLLFTSYLLFNPKTLKIASPFVRLPSPTPTTKHQITLVAVGDIMLGRNVNVKMQKYQNFAYPFEKTANFLSSADITFGNLESPFFNNCPIVGSGTMKFCADYKAIEGLKFAGFDILSLENNHIGNYGKEGLRQTTELLTNNGILFSTNEITSYQANETTFGFLSFNFTFGESPQKALQSIEAAKNKVDILIVSAHWGNEYQKEPSKSQKDLAYKIIDSGARIILGHHPHVIQPIEAHKDGLIFYSLGNFVFDQMWSEETKEGLVAKIIFEGKNIKDCQGYKVLISDYSQPDFLTSP